MGSYTESERIVLGRWNRQDLDRVLAAAGEIAGTGRLIEFHPGMFNTLQNPYSTLIGTKHTPEMFTITLGAVDCFTYLDYVEAMRRSNNFATFKETLKIVRYRAGKVDYTSRNHFFTDWIESNPFVRDVTAGVGREKTKTIHKTLNDRGDGTYFLSGILPVGRDITYVPGRAIDTSILRRLRNGDYVGIYSRAKGLDVSHVGVVIKTRGKTFLRHASSSSSHRKVIQEDFLAYVAVKPGMVVLRPGARTRPLSR
jgi:hypothetical protein